MYNSPQEEASQGNNQAHAVMVFVFGTLLELCLHRQQHHEKVYATPFEQKHAEATATLGQHALGLEQ